MASGSLRTNPLNKSLISCALRPGKKETSFHPACFNVFPQGIYQVGLQIHPPLFVPFPYDREPAFLPVDVRHPDPLRFPHPKPTGVEELEEHLVAMLRRCLIAHGSEESLNLRNRQGSGQSLGNLGSRYAARRILLTCSLRPAGSRRNA